MRKWMPTHLALYACATWLVTGTLLPSGASAKNFGVDTDEMVNGPVSCSGFGCHDDASDEVFVTITGPPALTPDETGSYTIQIFESVPGSLNSQAGAGLNVTALIDGVLSDIDDGVLAEDALNTQITGGMLFSATGQITHVAANISGTPANSIGVFSYDFTVTPPSGSSELELRAAMNAFNNNNAPTGDKWSSTSLFITVPEPGAMVLATASLVALAGLRRPQLRSAC